jgi:predicted GIY-YIG superfamily endonuclease
MNIQQAIVTAQPRPAVYVLSGTVHSRRYTGACRNLIERLKDHRAGRVSRTQHDTSTCLQKFELT